jgi:hypothetical protein
MSRPGSATSSPMRPASSGASIQFASRMSGKPQSSRRHRAGPPSDDLSGTRYLGREVDGRAVGVTSGPGLWRRPCECGQEPQPQGDQRLLRGTGISGLGRLLRWTHALRYEKHSREGWARTQRHAPGSCVQVSSRWCMEGARSALQTRSSSPGSQHTTGTGGLGGEEDRRDGWASPVARIGGARGPSHHGMAWEPVGWSGRIPRVQRPLLSARFSGFTPVNADARRASAGVTSRPSYDSGDPRSPAKGPGRQPSVRSPQHGPPGAPGRTPGPG